MKKTLFYAFALLCTVSVFTACHKTPINPEPTPKPTPPTVEDIVASYSGDKLQLTVAGAEAGAEPKVEILKGAGESTVNLRLFNIIPDNAEYTVKDVKFESATKSVYYSKLTGSAEDNLAGIKITIDGKVDETVLTLTVKLEKIEGQPVTNAADLFSTYKGEMQVSLSGTAAGDPSEQRVYASEASENKDSSIKLAIKNFSFSGLAVGDITFDNIPVTKRGEVYVFGVNGRELKVNVGGTEMTLMANVEGTILKGEMKLSVDLSGEGLEINVAFGGKAVKENTTAEVSEFIFENGDAIKEREVNGKNTTVYLWDNTPADKLMITPKPQLSEGASIVNIEAYYNSAKNEVKEGEAIDFSLFKDGEYIRYTVQAEDPSVTAAYIVFIKWLKGIQLVYDFSSWISNEQPAPFDFEEPTGWATSNGAATFLKAIEAPNSTEENVIYYYDHALPFPISKTSEGHVKILTVDTKGGDMYFSVVPAATAGTMFLGAFEINTENTLKSTHFGVPFSQKPLSLKMDYKYTPGPTYYKTLVEGTKPGERVVTKEEVPNETDMCSINGILYEVSNYQETLDGTNTLTSDMIVATALLPDGSGKVDFTSMEVPFTYIKEYDPAKKYKLAVICSSSAKGDKFEGAPGSELIIMSIEITVE